MLKTNSKVVRENMKIYVNSCLFKKYDSNNLEYCIEQFKNTLDYISKSRVHSNNKYLIIDDCINSVTCFWLCNFDQTQFIKNLLQDKSNKEYPIKQTNDLYTSLIVTALIELGAFE